MTDKIKTGNKGEELAANFLVAKGYAIVAKNYRYKHAEIDLIARKDQWLIFVEVKTRHSVAFGEPESFVTNKKAAKVIEGAEQYVFEQKWAGPIRFDIVSIKLDKEIIIEHFEDAFY
ncbi:MAG: YraN family protein [Cyclobacteriaceae bacterium]|nr:YraN family protein [Cyclobacteriaceae bacterium]